AVRLSRRITVDSPVRRGRKAAPCSGLTCRRCGRRETTVPADRLGYIVDDDEAVRDSLSLLLVTRGYTVRAFASAPEFLSAAPSLRPGCLIADIRMPEMDGLELQQRLIDEALPFPLIVITGHGDVPLAVRAMKVGAIDFIEKPFPAETIIKSAAAALARLPESADR